MAVMTEYEPVSPAYPDPPTVPADVLGFIIFESFRVEDHISDHSRKLGIERFLKW